MEVDVIVVGQGIVGTCLSFALIQEGKTVVVIDEENPGSSSRVASGAMNPVVFKRLTKSWKADEILPAAQAFYQDIEGILEEKYLFTTEIYKIFSTPEEQNLWLSKSDSLAMKKHIQLADDCLPDSFRTSFGCGIVKSGSQIILWKLLKDYRQWLEMRNALVPEKMDYKAVSFPDDRTVNYKDISAKKIIFCEGATATSNPWFSYLPFVPTKGEVLTIRSSEIPEDRIISKDFFILPIGDQKFRVGATYEWSDLSETVTEKAREALQEKLEKVFKGKYEVIDQQAGIRPAVKDRRPLIGYHSKHPQLGILNGMGTKGVMIAPFFSKIIAREEIIPEEVNINRCIFA